MSNDLHFVASLRGSYHAVKAALPWLDASRCDGDPPAFTAYARPPTVPGVRRSMLCAPDDTAADLVVYDPDRNAGIDVITDNARRLIEARTPLVLLHTDVDVTTVGEIAEAHPDLQIIIESGPRKLLYHYEALRRTLAAHSNVYLSTYNLLNWMGLEELCAAGLGERLLYGSHAPRYSEDMAMGPIAMADILWSQKCGIAGNNLRRLLGRAEAAPPEQPFTAPSPFIIDAHAHCVRPGRTTVNPFPSPDQRFSPGDWLAFMDRCAGERMILTPMETIFDAAQPAHELARDLCLAAPARFAYLEAFHPDGDAAHLQRLGASLQSASCAGIKIHPTVHRISGDDDRYAPAFCAAAESGKPVMTHSWEISEYNPDQQFSHPDRFRRWLREFPDVCLVLGHAGGRPSSFDSVVSLCREFPQLRVDLAGDYCDNGLVEALVAELGTERVLFGSDVDWFDPRAHIALVLGSQLTDDEALSVLRGNAAKTYLSPLQQYSTGVPLPPGPERGSQ